MSWTRVLTCAALVAVMGLSACTNTRRDVNLLSTSKQVIQSLQKKPPPPPPAALEKLAIKALKSTNGPLAAFQLEAVGAGSVIRNIETNGAYKTWSAWGTSQRLTITTKHGMITATRGLGNDLMSADVDDVLRLVMNRKEGTVQYEQRYLDGNHTIREVETTCEVTRGYEQTIRFGEVNQSAMQMFSACINENLQFVDLFVVGHNGRILQLRQWVGPVLGFGVIQQLR